MLKEDNGLPKRHVYMEGGRDRERESERGREKENALRKIPDV